MQPFGVRQTPLQKHVAFVFIDIFVGQKSFDTYLDRGYGRFELMINIVGKLFFNALFLCLFMQCGTMLAVAVRVRFLQAGIKSHNIVGDLSELVMGERFCIGYPCPVFHIFRKFFQPHDIQTETSRCEIAQYAHGHRYCTHDPYEAVIGLQQRTQRQGVGNCRAYHISACAFFCRVEIILTCTFAVAPQRIAAAVGKCLTYFCTVEMVAAWKRVECVVIDYISLVINHAETDLVKRMEFRQSDFRYIVALLKFRDYIRVYQLELGIDLFSLEFLFPVILEHDKTPYEQHGVSQ